jgi:LmbE family N-acetylglucosaminyl deacetylase
MQLVSILSPHRDDAAFSLALFITRCSQLNTRIRVVNFFTLSAYGPHAACDGMQCVSYMRAREDRKALTLISPSIEIVDGNFLDAPIRLNIPASAVCRAGTHSLLTTALIETVASEIKTLTRGSLVLAPLGLGNHVDHLAARAAAVRSVPPQRLAFYEDLPYATSTPANDLADRVKQTGHESGCRLKPVLLRAPCAVWRKRRIVARYESQITRDEATSIARWAAQYGGGERIWIPAVSRAWRLLVGRT